MTSTICDPEFHDPSTLSGREVRNPVKSTSEELSLEPVKGVPLKARQRDKDFGKIDLFGIVDGTRYRFPALAKNQIELLSLSF